MSDFQEPKLQAGYTDHSFRFPRALLVPLVVLLVGGVAWLMEGSKGALGLAVGTSSPVSIAPSGPTPQVGGPAPDFALSTIDGQQITLSELKGKSVLVNFWATWCPPCRAEMPDLEEAYQAYKDQGFVVLAVNLQENPSAVRKYAETLRLSFPILLDPMGQVVSRYSVTALPSSFFIDREGVIKDINVGSLTQKTAKQKVGRIL